MFCHLYTGLHRHWATLVLPPCMIKIKRKGGHDLETCMLLSYTHLVQFTTCMHAVFYLSPFLKADRMGPCTSIRRISSEWSWALNCNSCTEPTELLRPAALAEVLTSSAVLFEGWEEMWSERGELEPLSSSVPESIFILDLFQFYTGCLGVSV